MTILFDLIDKGGWTMYPILLASLVGLGIVLERGFALRRSKVAPRPLLVSVSQFLDSRAYEDAAFICRDGASAAARLMRLAFKMTSLGRAAFREAMEEVGRRESSQLFSHLGLLGVIASVSPLLGLLGTVSGMIKAFGVIAVEGMGNPGVLAGGIAEALISTAAGLCVAIPALVAHRLLAGRAEALTGELEELSADLMDALAAPEDKNLFREAARAEAKK